jgi:hypothetical protein
MTADQHAAGHPADHHEKAHSGADTAPAFTGLIVGAVLLFALLSSIVTITTKHYERLEKAAPAAQQ